MNIDQLKKQMNQYFVERKNHMQKNAKQLQKSGQMEQAQLEMEKLDVYDIFGTMMEASALKATMNPKYAGQDRTKVFCQQYLMAFISKPAEWRLKYASAKEKGDEKEMALQELRLSTVQEIRDEFVRITKEN